MIFDLKGHQSNFVPNEIKENLCGFKALSMRFVGSRHPLTRGSFCSAVVGLPLSSFKEKNAKIEETCFSNSGNYQAVKSFQLCPLL